MAKKQKKLNMNRRIAAASRKNMKDDKSAIKAIQFATPVSEIISTDVVKPESIPSNAEVIESAAAATKAHYAGPERANANDRIYAAAERTMATPTKILEDKPEETIWQGYGGYKYKFDKATGELFITEAPAGKASGIVKQAGPKEAILRELETVNPSLARDFKKSHEDLRNERISAAKTTEEETTAPTVAAETTAPTEEEISVAKAIVALAKSSTSNALGPSFAATVAVAKKLLNMPTDTKTISPENRGASMSREM